MNPYLRSGALQLAQTVSKRAAARDAGIGPRHRFDPCAPVPVSALHGPIDENVMLAVNVGEDSILVLQAPVACRSP